MRRDNRYAADGRLAHTVSTDRRPLRGPRRPQFLQSTDRRPLRGQRDFASTL